MCFPSFFLSVQTKHQPIETRTKRYWQSRALPTHCLLPPRPPNNYTHTPDSQSPLYTTRAAASPNPAHTRVRTSGPVSPDLISCTKAKGERSVFGYSTCKFRITAPFAALRRTPNLWIPAVMLWSFCRKSTSHTPLMVNISKPDKTGQLKQRRERERDACICPSMILRPRANHNATFSFFTRLAHLHFSQ